MRFRDLHEVIKLVPSWHDQGVHDLTHEVLTSHLKHVVTPTTSYYDASGNHREKIKDDLGSIGWHELVHPGGPTDNDVDAYVHPNHMRELVVRSDDEATVAHWGSLRQRDLFDKK